MSPETNLTYRFFGNAFVQGVSVFIALAVAFSGKLDAHGTLVAVLIAGAIGFIGIYTHCSSTTPKKILSVFSILVYGSALWAFYTYLIGKPVVSAQQSPPPSQAAQPPPQAGGDKAKPSPGSKPKSAPAAPPSISTGPITQGPCSNVQVGGSNNQATTNCGLQLPPARVLTQDNWIRLKNELKATVGSVQVVSFSEGDSEDVLNLHKQLVDVFNAAGWSVVYPDYEGSPTNVLVTSNGGQRRLEGKSLVCAAKESDVASKVIEAFGHVGLTCIADPDFYMPYGYAALMANSHPTLVILISRRIPK